MRACVYESAGAQVSRRQHCVRCRGAGGTGKRGDGASRGAWCDARLETEDTLQRAQIPHPCAAVVAPRDEQRAIGHHLQAVDRVLVPEHRLPRNPQRRAQALGRHRRRTRAAQRGRSRPRLPAGPPRRRGQRKQRRKQEHGSRGHHGLQHLPSSRPVSPSPLLSHTRPPDARFSRALGAPGGGGGGGGGGGSGRARPHYPRFGVRRRIAGRRARHHRHV